VLKWAVQPPSPTVSRSPLSWVIPLVFATAMGIYYFGIFLPHAGAERRLHNIANGYWFGDDFYPAWLSSREWLLHHRNPYSPEMTRQIQIGLFGRPIEPQRLGDPATDYRAFSYPAFVDVLVIPLVWLPFSLARTVIALVLPVVTGFSAIWWLRFMNWRLSHAQQASVIVLMLFTYPVLEGLFAEQLGLIAAAALAASFAALAAGRGRRAGGFLALASIKPQMCLLTIVFLMLWAGSDWRQRRKSAVVLGVGVTLLCALGLLVSPTWPQQWARTVVAYRHYSTPPLVFDLFGAYLGGAVAAGLLLVAGALAWRMRGVSAASMEFASVVGILLGITVVIFLPGHAVYDHVVLLPSVLLLAKGWREIASERRIHQGLLALAASALFWQWAAALAVVGFYLFRMRIPDPVLPLRTASSLPFALLVPLLWWGFDRSRYVFSQQSRSCEPN